jgi:hypothetical protein
MTSLSFPSSPNDGDTYSFNGLTYVYIASKNKWSIQSTTTITGITADSINTNLVPSSNVSQDLGTSSNSWRDLYLSGNSIFLGTGVISASANGSITLPSGSKIGQVPIRAGEEPTQYVQLNQSGELPITTGTVRWYVPSDITVEKIIANLGEAPVGSNINIRLNKNGVSFHTISVPENVTQNTSNNLNLTANEGDYFTVDITGVGSSTAGSDLNLVIEYVQ